MERFRFFTLIFLIALVACTTQPATSPADTAVPPTIVPTATAIPTQVSPFSYDASVPFDTSIISQTEQDGVTVTELSYAAYSPSFAPNMGGRSVATLVSPKGNGPFAGILYMHMFGTDRHEYLNEALTMAQHGAVSLLSQGYFPWTANPTGTQADRPLIIGQVIELRRAIDFLLTQPGVDPRRLGYVGHTFGATYGGILAGVDKRLKTFVLIAGFPSFAVGFTGWGVSIDYYLAQTQDLDPVKFVPNAAPASLFFQFAKNDTLGITESLANQYYNAASQPKKIAWYDDSTNMVTAPVVADRQEWLIDQLNLVP